LDSLINKESGVIRKTAINAKREPFC